MKSLSIKLGVILIAVAIFYSSSSFAEIEVKYDRFKNRTVVQTDPKKIGGTTLQPALVLVGTYIGRTPSTPATCTLEFVSTASNWEYLRCHSLSCLADGSLVKLPPSEHSGSRGRGRVMEFISITIPFTIIERLSKCGKIEFKLCNTEFTLTKQETQDLRTFVEAFTQRR